MAIGNTNTLAKLAAGLLTLLSIHAMAGESKKITPRAGLWQIDSQTLLFGHVVPDVGAMLRLGPEKLQNHVANMLQQNRVTLNGDGTANACVTARQIAKNDYVNYHGSGCYVSTARRAGNTLHFDINCEAPKGTGYTVVQLLDRTHWEANTRLTLTVRGITQNIDNKSYGTWLKASCTN